MRRSILVFIGLLVSVFLVTSEIAIDNFTDASTTEYLDEIKQPISELVDFSNKISEILIKHNIDASEAEILLLAGTAAVETDLGRNVNHQGIFQIERGTAKWAEEVIKKRHPEVHALIIEIKDDGTTIRHNIENNFEYQVVLAYYIYKIRGIDKHNIDSSYECSFVWKKLWNTSAGVGTPRQFVRKWNLYNQKIVEES